MLDKVTVQAPLSQPTNAASALRALAWATQVGTSDPEALSAPPPVPTPAEWASVRVETLREHLDELLLGRHTQEGLDALHVSGALDAWLPEISAMVGFGDGEWRPKDV